MNAHRSTVYIRAATVVMSGLFLASMASGQPPLIPAEDVFGPSNLYNVISVGNAIGATSQQVRVPLYLHRGADAKPPMDIAGALRYRTNVLAPTEPAAFTSEVLSTWYGKGLVANFLPPDETGWGTVLFYVQEFAFAKGDRIPSAPITTFDDQRPGGNPENRINPFPLGEIVFAVVGEPGQRTPLELSEIVMETTDFEGVRNVSWLNGVFTVGFDGDNDGMTTAYETQMGLNPEDGSDGDDNPDGDALTNLEEFILGTDAREADVPSEFHVSPDGNDETGTGMADAPYRTIQHAVSQAARFAAPFHPVTVRVEPGVYVGSVFLLPYVFVEGTDRTNTFIEGDPTLGFPVVSAAANSGLSTVTVRFTSEPAGMPPLVEIDRVPFQLHNVVLDGNLTPLLTGVLARGEPSSGSFLSDNQFTRLAVGLHAINSGLSLARNHFIDLIDAVVADGLSKADLHEVAPILGKFPDTERTGLNWFREIEHLFVVNASRATLPCEMCDWGLTDPAVLDALIDGPSDAEPFMAKSIGPSAVIVTVKDGATNQVLPKTTPALVEIQVLSLNAELDDQTGLYVFAAIPNGSHTIRGEAAGIGVGTATTEVQGLAPKSVSLPLVNGGNGNGNGGGSTGCKAAVTPNGPVARNAARGNLLVEAAAVALLAGLALLRRRK